MRTLIVKTSSLGDIVHTFPALTDACHALGKVQFDWVVEECFASMPRWHPAVGRVICSAFRRWRGACLRTIITGEWRRFTQDMRAEQYDAVIDAQGLIKSGLITYQAVGVKHGFDRQSIREPVASRFYNKCYRVDKDRHAIERTRQLFAQALDYSVEGLPLQYGLSVGVDAAVKRPSILFLHGTTWPSKRWPITFWKSLAQLALAAGYQVFVPSDNAQEKQFADALAALSDAVITPQQKSLAEMAALIKAVDGVVSVDTGLAHLAVALGTPTVGLYGATDKRLTGILGAQGEALQADVDCSPCLRRVCPKLQRRQIAAPCTANLSADTIWRSLRSML